MAKKKQNQIIGAGGGGGGAANSRPANRTVVQQSAPPAVRTPIRTADNLASTALATFLTCLAKVRLKASRLPVITRVARIITTWRCSRMFI
jgi:hypothetical protein